MRNMKAFPIIPNTPGGDNGLPCLSVGDWVEVLNKEDILKTLDKNGQLDGMPFMPEMFAFCGKRFRVYKRAHKTCDTVNDYKGRRLQDAVHLEGLRCNGQSHGGCEASCLIFWKTAWLRPVDQTSTDSMPLPAEALERRNGNTQGCTEAYVVAGARKHDAGSSDPVYVCQATQLPAATQPLPWWEWRQYVEDYTSGNVSLGRIVKSFAYVAYRDGLVNLGIGIGPVLMWLYDKVQSLRGAALYPRDDGTLPAGTRTPAINLNLQPGEWVRVKSRDTIRATCDESRMNRGMTFDKEMVPYCGGTYQVLKRVTKLVNEKTGKLQEMKNPCIILDSVVCQARYSQCRMFCSRSIYPYWREIWLERVEPIPSGVQEAQAELCDVSRHR